MIVKLTNTINEVVSISDIGISFLPMQEETYDTDVTPLQTSNVLLSYISNGTIKLNNLTSDLSPVEAIKYLLDRVDILPRGKDGKVSVHATSKAPGLFVYWAGRGDNFVNNYVGNGTPILLHHKIGDSKAQQIYIDFCSIDNYTEMHEGSVIWNGAMPGDSGSCSAVTSVMPTSAGVNTNFNLYGGYLIVPAAGNGTLQVLGDLTNIDPSKGCFVKVYTDETGARSPAFWNADYNPSTRKFENISPAPAGNGEFNLFAVEIYASRFVNHINLIGSGQMNLRSEDSTVLSHGLRLLHHMNTSTLPYVDDHEWTFSVVLTLQRDRTY
jgi:hypothetical protein